MVLFSATTQTPLAALKLKAGDLGCLSMLPGRLPPIGASEAYFQGMLNKPDQGFTLTISNLSNEGFIKFDLLHSPCEVSQVNPGPEFAINEVSVLSPNQSYTVRADQRNNRRMILGGKVKQPRFPLFSQKQETRMKVKHAAVLPTGFNFFLNVVAEKDRRSLVKKFSEGTPWKLCSASRRDGDLEASTQEIPSNEGLSSELSVTPVHSQVRHPSHHGSFESSTGSVDQQDSHAPTNETIQETPTYEDVPPESITSNPIEEIEVSDKESPVDRMLSSET